MDMLDTWLYSGCPEEQAKKSAMVSFESSNLVKLPKQWNHWCKRLGAKSFYGDRGTRYRCFVYCKNVVFITDAMYVRCETHLYSKGDLWVKYCIPTTYKAFKELLISWTEKGS